MFSHIINPKIILRLVGSFGLDEGIGPGPIRPNPLPGAPR